jgi:hypothetical protein
MSDTTQIVGVTVILFILIIQYAKSKRSLKLTKKDIKKYTDEENFGAADELTPLLLYCEARMFIISMISVLLVGMVIF